MKKTSAILLALIFLVNLSFSQDTIRLIPGSSTIHYLQKQPGGKASDVRNVPVKIVYWKGAQKDSLRKDVAVNFTITNYGSKLKTENITEDYVITKDKITAKHDTFSLNFHFSINAIADMAMPEFFDIKLKGGGTETHRIVLQKDTLPYKTVLVIQPKPKEAKDTGSITYLNGASFDFEKKTPANYVGIFNILCPEIKSWPTRFDKFRLGFGFNAGIMKTNYSLSGDSLNSSMTYTEAALFNPLDSVKSGKECLRQYNKLDVTSKNTTFTFYSQFLLGGYFGDHKFQLFTHAHAELLANKWTTNSTVTNIQQDTILIPNTDFKPSEVNKFSKSTADPVKFSSTSTSLSYYAGGGITCIVKPWMGATFFIQYTTGKVINYGQPTSVNKENLETKYDNNDNFFYLTRASLSQRIIGKVEVILGTEFRGVYKVKEAFSKEPLYVCYIGVNIDVNSLKELFKP